MKLAAKIVLGTLFLFVALVAWIFIPQLFFDVHTTRMFNVETAEGETRGTLDPNVTYQEVPELAKALDELIHTNQSHITVVQDDGDGEAIDRFIEHLRIHHGGSGNFKWRWATVNIGMVIT